MPQAAENNLTDRAEAQTFNMHPRLNADMILAPSDILEGIGDLVAVDASGDPIGWRLGQPEKPDGRHVYIGSTPDTCTRQTHKPLDYARPSHLVDYELVPGRPYPTPNSPMLAQVPRPENPLLKKLPASSSGLPASTPQSPHWFAWAFVDNGKLTTRGTPVPFHTAHGQGARVPLPASMPEGIHEVALLVPAPGTSRPDRPGPMYVQRIVDMRTYFLPTYDLTSFRFNRPAATTNETTISDESRPRLERISSNTGARIAGYQAKIVWTDDSGKTLAGSASNNIMISFDPRYSKYSEPDEEGNRTLEFSAGRGAMRITRSEAPKTATGWQIYIYMTPPDSGVPYKAGWRRVYDRYNNQGTDTKPFPLSKRSVTTSGWAGDEEYYGGNDSVILQDAELPTENTTGVEPPEDAPETPVAFGPSRPAPQTLFVRVTDTVKGVESLPSAAVQTTIGADDLLAVVFVNPTSLFPNSTFIETDPDNRPLYWKTTTTGGTATVIDGEYVIETNGVVTGTTPEAFTDTVSVDATVSCYLEGDFVLEEPISGSLQGSVEVVLRQLDKNGNPTDQLLKTASLAGEISFSATLLATGSTGSFVLLSTTIEVQVFYRFAGASKNLRKRLRQIILRRHRHKPRRPRRPRHPRPPTPPGTPGTGIIDPPEPPHSPETYPSDPPDRPFTTHPPLETLTFESGLPAEYTPSTTGTATVGTAAAAAIDGASGLRIQKASAGTLSTGLLSKTFAPPSSALSFRHWLAEYTRTRIGTWPVAGKIKLHPLCRPSDNDPIAWFEASTAVEISKLTLTDEPLNAGNVTISLDGTPTSVAVLSTKEVASLTINSAPTASGTVTVNLDGTPHNFEAGGEKEVTRLTIAGRPRSTGYVTLTLGGKAFPVRVLSTDTIQRVMARIAFQTYHGWQVEVSAANQLTFTATLPGPRTDATFSAGTTRLPFSIATPVQGSSESADELAARIRAGSFTHWVATQGAQANIVIFTAVTGGLRKDATFQAGSTGATATMSTTTQGSIDTAAQVAARIRATVFTGWTLTGSGVEVTFTANNAGVKTNATYNPQATGASGTMRIIQQGSNADITAYVKHSDGTIEYRKIMAGVSNTTIVNLDVSVSGAGTSRAVVTFWGSTGAGTLAHLERFEDINLTDHPAGVLRLGVFEESSAGLTWDVHVDTVKPSDKGLTYYEDHNVLAQWLNQAYGYYGPGQPHSQDLLLQDGAAAVFPLHTYVLSARLRLDNPTDRPARPLVVTAHGPNGYNTELGDITGTQASSPGLSGLVGWTEFNNFVMTIPENCYRITIGSKDIGAGEFVIQQVTCSPGETPLRDYRYATSGYHRPTFDTRTPKTRPELKFWSHQRISLGCVTEAPAGTTTTVQYTSSAVSEFGPWSTAQTLPENVPEGAFIKTHIDATGDGAKTPVIKAGSPYCDYVLMGTPTKRLSTLLKHDRTELPGGVAFERLTERSTRNTAGRRRLPSGELYDDPRMFEGFGHLPESVLLVFSAAAKKYLEDNWREPFYLESFGEVAELKLSGQPEFAKQVPKVVETSDGGRHAVWSATLGVCQVKSVSPL